jgi:hypothetical protein
MEKLSLWFRGIASTPDWSLGSFRMGDFCNFTPTSTRTADDFREYAILFLHSQAMVDAVKQVLHICNEPLHANGQNRAAELAMKIAFIHEVSTAKRDPELHRFLNPPRQAQEYEPNDDGQAAIKSDMKLDLLHLKLNRSTPNPRFEISTEKHGVICRFSSATAQDSALIEEHAKHFCMAPAARSALESISALCQTGSDAIQELRPRLDSMALVGIASVARDFLRALDDFKDGSGERINQDDLCEIHLEDQEYCSSFSQESTA